MKVRDGSVVRARPVRREDVRASKPGPRSTRSHRCHRPGSLQSLYSLTFLSALGRAPPPIHVQLEPRNAISVGNTASVGVTSYNELPRCEGRGPRPKVTCVLHRGRERQRDLVETVPEISGTHLCAAMHLRGGGRHRRKLGPGLQQIPFCAAGESWAFPARACRLLAPSMVRARVCHSQPPRVWLLVMTAVGAVRSGCQVPRSLGGLHPPCRGPSNSPSQSVCTPSSSVPLTGG